MLRSRALIVCSVHCRAQHGMHLYQLYADGSQLYLHVMVSDRPILPLPLQYSVLLLSSMTSIIECVSAGCHALQPATTDVMWLGSSQQHKHVNIGDIPVLSINNIRLLKG